MWSITSVKTPESYQTLVFGATLIIGKNHGDITCKDDKSVSRKHAEISLDYPDDGKISSSKIVLRDLKSKFGTYVNNSKIYDHATLASGDTIQFGMQWSKYKVEFRPLVVAASSLHSSEKRELKHYLHELGGLLESEWNQKCIMLIMNKFSLTVKTVCALASGCPIVTIQYLKDTCSAIKEKLKVPDPDDYTPLMCEVSLLNTQVNLCSDDNRKHLFTGITVYFFTPIQQGRLKLAIELAGGKVSILQDQAMFSLFDTAANIVISPPPNYKLNEDQLKLSNYLKEKKIKMIPESEVGLGILFCSTEKYCNPFYQDCTIVSEHPPILDTHVSDSFSKSFQSETNNMSCEDIFTTPKFMQRHKRPNDDIILDESVEVPIKKTKLNEPPEVSNTYDSLFSHISDTDTVNELCGNRCSEDDYSANTIVGIQPTSHEHKISTESLTNVHTSPTKPKRHSSYTPINQLHKKHKIDPDATMKCQTADASAKKDDGGNKKEHVVPISALQNSVEYPVQMKQEDSDAESNLMQISVIQLVIKSKSSNIEKTPAAIKNFKKFKKSHPLRKMSVTVIGETDLAQDTPSTVSKINDHFNELTPTLNNDEEYDPDVAIWNLD